MIKLRNPFTMEKKDYIGNNKGNNKNNEYLKQLDRQLGHRDIALRDINPDYLRDIYSNPKTGNTIVRSIIDASAQLTAEVSKYVKLRDIKSKKEIDIHPALDAINRANDIECTRSLLFKRWSIDYDLYGENFTTKVKTGVGTFARYQLYPMFANLVEIKLGGLESPIKGFVLNYNENIINKEPNTVMWMANYNPNEDAGYHGLSPLVSAAKQLQILEAGDKRILSTFNNGGADFLLSPKTDGASMKGIDPEKVQDAEDEINDINNNGKTKVLRMGMDLIKLGDNAVNLGVLQTSEFAIKIICLAYRYPYSMIEDIAKYSNQKEAKKRLYTDIGIPKVQMIIEYLNTFLELTKEGKEFFIDIEAIDALREDVNVIMNAYVSANASVNAKFKLLGLEPLKDKIYDEPIIPMGVEMGYTKPSELDLTDEE